MKLRFFSTLQSIGDGIIAALEWVTHYVRKYREWAWIRASAANLDSCNDRQALRTRFN